MALSPTPSCSHCNINSSSVKLLLCQACKVVHYCNREHQVAHRENHKKACNAINKSQKVLDREETKLRSHPGDFMTPPNLFEEQVGHFWGILDTRDYMRARYALVEALLKVKTYAAIEAAHDHCMDILRLCSSDNMGIRDKVPTLKLRLGKDQECYEFCKWWATTNGEGHCDWGNMSNPYLEVKDADPFESPQKIFIKKFGDLNHCVAITLLKIKLLMDVRELQNASVIGKKVPQEILDGVQSQLVSGSVVAQNKDVMNAQDRTTLIVNLEGQVEELHEAVDHINEYFWQALLDPEEHLNAEPEAFSHGSFEEMEIVLQQNYDAWMETPGAVDMIRQLEPESEPEFY